MMFKGLSLMSQLCPSEERTGIKPSHPLQHQELKLSCSCLGPLRGEINQVF